MVVNNFGYYFAVAMVSNIDIDTGYISLFMMPDDPVISNIVTLDSKGYKIEYISLYSPNLRFSGSDKDESHYNRLKDEDVFNVASGFINRPKINDYLFIAVFLYKDSNTPFYLQLMNKPIYILGQIQKHMPILNINDNLIQDQSGAKLHFNNDWFLDVKTDRPTGNTTLVGNRLTTLSGKKFLNFSQLSYLFQKDITNKNPKMILHPPFIKDTVDKDDKVIVDESITWKDVFTKEVKNTNIFVPKFTGELQSLKDKLFLEPAAPPEDGKLDMHESGWKKAIYKDGNVQEFQRASMKMIGKTGLPYAFAPDGKQSNGEEIQSFDPDEVAVFQGIETQSDGVDLEYHHNGTDVIATEKNKKGSGLEEQIRSGVTIYIPDIKPGNIKAAQVALSELQSADGGAEIGKFKIVVGSVIFEITNETVSITAPDIIWKGDFTVEGSLIVDGDISTKASSAGKITADGDIKGVNVEGTTSVKAGTGGVITSKVSSP